mgnify:FL=1
MIEVKNVNFKYSSSNKDTLSNIDLKINKDESVGIIGANGAGKSTILKLLVGLELQFQGEILINDLKVEKKNLSEIRRKIGYVFQDSEAQLFMPTIYEDVAFAPKNYGYSEEKVHERTIKALESVGITDLKDRQIYRLSGGQKKLASIATVLSMNPEILIFDEPTVTLDPKNRRRFIEILNSLKTTKIVTSHDLDLIYDTCDRTILVAEGKIVKDGRTKEILENKELLENNGLELPLSLIKR